MESGPEILETRSGRVKPNTNNNNSNNKTDIKTLKKEMTDFLLGKKNLKSRSRSIIGGDKCQYCQLCLKEWTASEADAKNKVTINDRDLFQSLLLQDGDCERALQDRNHHGDLLLCRNCLSSLLKLGLLFKQLRKLGEEFNALRLEIGKGIIRKSLGKSEAQWKCWEKEVKLVGYSFAVKEVETSLSFQDVYCEEDTTEDFCCHDHGERGESVVKRRRKCDPNLSPVMVQVPKSQLREEDCRLVSREVEIDEDNDWMEIKEEEDEEDDSLNTKEDLDDFSMPSAYFCEQSSSPSPPPEGNEHLTTSTKDDPSGPSKRVLRNRKPEIETMKEDSEWEFILPDNSNGAETDDPDSDNDSSNSQSEEYSSALKPVKQPKKRIRNSRKNYPCQFCDALFVLAREWRDHLRLEHKFIPPITRKPRRPRNDNDDDGLELQHPFVCNECQTSYSSLKSLMGHKQNIHGKKPYERSCPEPNCGIIFTERAKLYEHKRKHHGHVPGERQVTCALCLGKFHSFKELVRHKREEEGYCTINREENMKKNRFKVNCDYCDLSFEDKHKFRSHKLIVHGAGSIKDGHFQCEFCLKFYNNVKGLKYHKRLIHYNCPYHLRRDYSRKESSFELKVETIKCSICKDSEICSSVEELKEHERTEEHAEEVKAKIAIHCNVCRESFNGNLSAFRGHLESEGHAMEVESLGEVNAAEFCVPCRVKVGEGESAWTRHNLSASHRKRCEFKEKTKEKLRLECPECPRVFEVQSRFDRHLKEKHGMDLSKDKCKNCGLEVSEGTQHECNNGKGHDEGVGDESAKVICEKCGKEISCMRNLHVHLKRVHEIDVSNCEDCGRSFKTRARLASHILTVHYVKQNDDGNRRQRVRDRLIKKKKAISGRNSTNLGKGCCPHCPETFNKAFKLRRHLTRVHPEITLVSNGDGKGSNNNKLFPCSVCFHIFPSKEGLDSHLMKNHAKCSSCGMQFKVQQALRRHERTHVKGDDRPHKCPFCECYFGTVKHLANHKKVRHNGAKELAKV